MLGDVVVCGSSGDGSVLKFEKAYRSICKAVRVSLADGSNPDKAFSATHTGIKANNYNITVHHNKKNP